MRTNEGYIPTSDGLRLFCQQTGSGRDAVVIPGAWLLDSNLLPLAARRTLVLYDVRGRGRSSAVRDESQLGMDRELDDLELVRKHFGLERMSLVGWSYLGAEVVLYAIRHPRRVSRILQICPIPPRAEPYMRQDAAVRSSRQDPGAQNKIARMREAGFHNSDPAAFCRAWYDTFLRTIVADPASVPRVRIRCDLPNEHPDRMARVMASMFTSLGNWDWRGDLGRLIVPTLTLAGDKDTFPLDGSREWTASLPNSRLFIMQDVGHLPFAEAPELFIAAAEVFLRGAWPDSAVELSGR